jgi:hypothetical protein
VISLGTNPKTVGNQEKKPMKNNPYKLGRKSNELWKKIREDKCQRTNIENKISSNRVPYGNIWRRKYEA